jgi:DNA-binding NtrC family response regulator
VLTDLRKPGMSGLELQAALRERRNELPVVVLSAHGNVATAHAASPQVQRKRSNLTACWRAAQRACTLRRTQKRTAPGLHNEFH